MVVDHRAIVRAWVVWGIATGAGRPYDAAVNEAWVCERCSTLNDVWMTGCSTCGSSRPDAATTDPSAAPESPSEPSGDRPADAAPVGWGTPGVPPTSLADEGVMPVAPTSKPLWQRIPVGWIIFAVVLFGGSIGGLIFNATRGSSGEIDRAGDLVITDLRVGDCFDLKDPTADEAEQVTARPCAQEHQYELMHVGVMPDGDYPTDGQFGDWLDANCTPAFEAYIGAPYETSIYEVFWFSPTKVGWVGGDHTVQCAVSHPTETRLTGSLRGIGE
jgi:hypothetical protein